MVFATTGASSIATNVQGVTSVAAVDVDLDGDLDVVTGAYIDDAVAWHENDGAQGFSQRVVFGSADGVYSVFAVDVDGDGDVDALSADALASTRVFFPRCER